MIKPDSIWQIQGWGLILLVFFEFFSRDFFHYQEYLFFHLPDPGNWGILDQWSIDMGSNRDRFAHFFFWLGGYY